MSSPYRRFKYVVNVCVNESGEGRKDGCKYERDVCRRGGVVVEFEVCLV